jgi:hypothetical protein
MDAKELKRRLATLQAQYAVLMVVCDALIVSHPKPAALSEAWRQLSSGLLSLSALQSAKTGVVVDAQALIATEVERISSLLQRDTPR